MLSSTTGTKKKPFDRTVFDFVATRDLTALKEAIDADSQSVVDARDANGFTVLHTAVAHSHEDIVRAFLGLPAEDTAVGFGGASSEAPSPTAKAKAGSRLPSRSGGGRPSATSVGENEGTTDSLGASANRPKSRSQSASKEKGKEKSLAGNPSLSPSQLPVAIQLPTLFMDVNATSSAGYTPLHIAAMRGYESIAGLLLRCGADPLRITRGVPREPLTAYQLARKHHWPRIEYLLEPLTYTPHVGAAVEGTADSGKKGIVVINRDGREDAAVEYVKAVDPLKAAADGNVFYFSLALLDLCGGVAGGSAVDEAAYAVGLEALHKIRSAVCPETGRNALMIAVDRDDVASLPQYPPSPSPTAATDGAAASAAGLAPCGDDYRLIVDLLTQPVVLNRHPTARPEESYEAVFVAGPQYPSWGLFRAGYVFPVGLRGKPIRPTLVSDRVYKKRGEGEGGDGEGEGEESDYGEDAQNTTLQGDADTSTVAGGGSVSGASHHQNKMLLLGDASGLPYCINAQNTQTNGYTVMHYVAQRGHAGLGLRLVEAMGGGIDATIVCREGYAAQNLIADADEGSESARLANALAELALRKTFLDMYNARDDVLPDDRVSYAEEARSLKRRWRDADNVLHGLPVTSHGDGAEGEDERSNGANNSTQMLRDGGDTTAPSSPQRAYDDDEGEGDEVEGDDDSRSDPRGNAHGPTPGPGDV